MKIAKYRNQIDEMDDQILALLNKRASLAIKIAQEKFDKRISVSVSHREEEIYERLSGQNEGPLQAQHIREIFAAIISTSKSLQHYYQSFHDV